MGGCNWVWKKQKSGKSESLEDFVEMFEVVAIENGQNVKFVVGVADNEKANILYLLGLAG